MKEFLRTFPNDISCRNGLGKIGIHVIIIGIVTFSTIGILVATGEFNSGNSCLVSAEGSGFYVTVISDSGHPVQGAKVSSTRMTVVNFASCKQKIGTLETNSTGSVLITPNIGSYYDLTISYQGKNYNTQAPIDPMQSTYVVLRVPSGNFNVSEEYEGGCQNSSGGIVCPG